MSEAPPAANRSTAVVVDDEPHWRELVAATLAQGGYKSMTASSVAEAMSVMSAGQIDVAIVDLGLPGPSGLTLIDQLSAVFPDTAVVVLTGHSERATAADALTRGADAYLIKPVQPGQLILATDGAIQKRRVVIRARTEQSSSEVIERLVRVAQARDLETGHHSGRMSEVSALLAEDAGLSPTAVERMRSATLLHDIGKVSVPDEILHKPGPLTEEERIEMQRHARVGWQILSGSTDPVLELAARIALAHHERWDGTGYPLGLAGEAIPIEARIAAVADVFEALSSDRPYRKALTQSQVCEHIRNGAGKHFDPEIVAAFLASERIRPLSGCVAEHAPVVSDADGVVTSGVGTQVALP